MIPCFRFQLRIAALACPLFMVLPLAAQTGRPPLNDPKSEARVEALLKQMTLEEKIGQLVQFSYAGGAGPSGLSLDVRSMLARGQIGSLYNVTGAKEVNELQKIAVEQSRLHIPLIFALDVIHGYRTEFPVPLGLAATWNPELAEKAARVAAIEASSEGIRWTFAPMVDIARDARWGRITEGAGEDTYLGSAFASAYVRGFQGRSLADPASLAACAKHYVAYGAAEGGRDYGTVDMSDRVLRQVYLPPFKAAVDAGAASLMSAFDSLQNVPASANRFTLTTVLRQEWGFRGVVISDWTAITELINHGIALDGATAARKALLAGVDMDMQANLYATTLADQVRDGRIPVSAIDEAARRVLRVKFALGLFDQPYTDESKSPIKNLAPEHRALAEEAAEESFVLLKNDPVAGAPLLPLRKDLNTLALIGPLADSASDMLGAWGAKGDPSDVVTLKSALAKRMNEAGGKLLFAKGAEILGNTKDGFAEALSAAQQSDVVVLALGEDAGIMTGEAASRASIGLPGNQEDLLSAVLATGRPVVLVLFNGRPLALPPTVSRVAALLEAWFPGVQAGPAVVRTLFGDVNPSGRLTASFPRAVGQEPLSYNALSTGRPASVEWSATPKGDEEKYVSRYIDVPNTPLFRFGYGLSYTAFEYSPISLSSKSLSAKALNEGRQSVKAWAEVKNAGQRPGKEVVQLYIRLRGTSVTRPVRELKGFRKISLNPGESKRVEFDLTRDELAFWNIDMKNVVEPAELTIWIAPSSGEGTPATTTIAE